MNDLSRYRHPYLSVDGVIFRYGEKRLEVLLTRREDELGDCSLPGGIVPVDRLAGEVLVEKVRQKTGVSGFYCEQLMLYDAIHRDPRGRIVSMAYLGLTNDPGLGGDWFAVDWQREILQRGEEQLEYSRLAFDHAQILRDARERLSGKLWWTDLMRYLLPDPFTIQEVENLVLLITGEPSANTRRRLGERLRECGKLSGSRRPALLYHWAE